MYDVLSHVQPISSHEYSLLGKGHLYTLFNVSLHREYIFFYLDFCFKKKSLELANMKSI